MIAVGTSFTRTVQPQREPPERRTDDDAAGDGEQKGRRHGAE